MKEFNSVHSAYLELKNYMLYNLQEIMDLCDNDLESVSDIVAQFVSDVPESINGLRKGLDKVDYTEMKFFAHRMKPAINSFQIFSIKEDVLLIEKLAEQKQLTDELVNLIERVEQTMKEVVATLKIEFKV